MPNLLTVEEAIEQIRQGKQIILVDDEDRENEGDLCMAAAKVSAEDINFMARFGRGLICLTLTEERARRLGLNKMAEKNESPFGTNFYVSIEAREGVTTGISAADRATTILAAIAPDANTNSVVSPGHIFPICARQGGVLVRSGQTEGSVDLARLAGLEPAGVICEIMKDDGTMARMNDLEAFAHYHGLGILTIAQLIKYRLQKESLVRQITNTKVIPAGLHRSFELHLFKSVVNEAQYLTLVLGEVRNKPVLVRMQSVCIPGNVFGFGQCLCEQQKLKALQKIEQAGAGVFVCIYPEKVDLTSQILGHVNGSTAVSQLKHVPGLPLELREFGLGAQVLSALGIKQIKLISDNPKKLIGLGSFGLEVIERIPLLEM